MSKMEFAELFCINITRKPMTGCQERRCGIAWGSGREVRENSARYVWGHNSGEVRGRSDGGVRGEGGTAPRIGFKPLFLCNGDG